ncbi:MAG: excinuclease ABC subunit UvrA [Kiritimatiellae bacterium]|nr:excinuclease ABC subunit UvrA [Kiritimatiellia bacterium]
MSDILITGAKQHNLKNINVRIPRDSLTVITGLSGSGKSSLAFDTLYAEGQRRYVQSLSAYARQFLDQMEKPDVEKIEGLSPAISIEQHTTGSNPRSIVATVTEIHDYLRLLYGSIGQAHCPQCGKPVRKQSADEIVDQLMKLPPKTKLVILAPLVRGRKGRHEDVLANVRKKGFVRVRVDGQMYALDDVPELDKKKNHLIDAVVDRLVAAPAIRSRLTDSVETALKEGGGIVMVQIIPPTEAVAPAPQDTAMAEEARKAEAAAAAKPREVLFSEKNACPECGISFEELKPRSFSFNSPFGACPTCSGIGALLVFDEDLVVPDKTKPLGEAIKAWRVAGHHAIVYYKYLLEAIATQYGVSLDTPYEKLSAKFRKMLMHGGDSRNLVLEWRNNDRPFEGVLATLKHRYEQNESDDVRDKLAQFMTRQVCPDCGGKRLRPESCVCTVGGKTIIEVMHMDITTAVRFFDGLKLSPVEQQAVGDILKEIRRRLHFILDVGLDYLSLDRESSTLSGGEMQRIRLATQIGSGLMGVLYVLDEPTIGLHPRDNERLITMLRALQQRGNTVVVVEHDEEMMRNADYIVDLGPGAGIEGGNVTYQGDYKGLLHAKGSLTADYLSGRRSVPVPKKRIKPGKERLRIYGAQENNLKNIDVEIPLGCFVVVTGVSGSGKSSLISDILKRYLFQKFYRSSDKPGKFRKITGDDLLDKVIEIDQSPIGRTPRSNPVTYTGAFTGIRELFAATPGAKMRGYDQGRFSFNVKGGRCEVCGGDGLRKLEMNFLPDVYVTCEQCNGARYNKETLEVRYNGKNIAEVLNMTVAEALVFFKNIPTVARKLETLNQVGLGYVGLGQSSTTLSGGEAQRIKLSAELSKRATGKTLYLLDEPTTGLHFDDVSKLLSLLLKLRESGNTIVVIEHNLDVIKCADYIIDLGPGGGRDGGNLVCAGTPEEVAACKESQTGRFLARVLEAK